MHGMRSLAFVLVSVVVLGIAPPLTPDTRQAEGWTVEALTYVDVTDTIPVGLLHNSKVLGTMDPGARAVVYEVKYVPTVVRTDEWLRVRVADTNVIGWVHNGSSSSNRKFTLIGLAG